MSANATTLGESAQGSAGLGLAVRKLVQGWRNRMMRRQAYNDLQSLDDRLLADIGINRGTILASLIEAERAQGVVLRNRAGDWLSAQVVAPRTAANSDDRVHRAA